MRVRVNVCVLVFATYLVPKSAFYYQNEDLWVVLTSLTNGCVRHAFNVEGRIGSVGIRP